MADSSPIDKRVLVTDYFQLPAGVIQVEVESNDAGLIVVLWGGDSASKRVCVGRWLMSWSQVEQWRRFEAVKS